MGLYNLNFFQNFDCVIIHRYMDVGMNIILKKYLILSFFQKRQQVIRSFWI